MIFELYQFQLMEGDDWVTQVDKNAQPLSVWLNSDQYQFWNYQLDGNRRLIKVPNTLSFDQINNIQLIVYKPKKYSYKYDDHRNRLKKLDFIRGYCKGDSRNTYSSEQFRQLVADEPVEKLDINCSVSLYFCGKSTTVHELTENQARDLYFKTCVLMQGRTKYVVTLICNNEVVQQEAEH